MRKLSPPLRIALVAGVLVHVFGFFFFRVISNPLPSPKESRPFIKYVSGLGQSAEEGLVEQASLFDSAPLFIPSEWSAVSGVFKPAFESDWEVFPEIPLRFDRESLLAEMRPVRLSLPQVTPVAEPIDLMHLEFWDLFASFGQNFAEPEEPASWGSLAVVRILGGNSAHPSGYTVNLTIDTALAESAARPLRFFLNMSAPGVMIGRPLVDQFSGSDAVDEEALRWIMRADILAQLPAGYLEVSVFP